MFSIWCLVFRILTSWYNFTYAILNTKHKTQNTKHLAKTKKPFKRFNAWRAAPSLLDPFVYIARSLSFAEWDRVSDFLPNFDIRQRSTFSQVSKQGCLVRQVFWLPRPFSDLPIPMIRNSGVCGYMGPLFCKAEKSGVTAAGPLPVLTGFPIKLTHLIRWHDPLREKRRQVKKIHLTKPHILSDSCCKLAANPCLSRQDAAPTNYMWVPNNSNSVYKKVGVASSHDMYAPFVNRITAFDHLFI